MDEHRHRHAVMAALDDAPIVSTACKCASTSPNAIGMRCTRSAANRPDVADYRIEISGRAMEADHVRDDIICVSATTILRRRNCPASATDGQSVWAQSTGPRLLNRLYHT